MCATPNAHIPEATNAAMRESLRSSRASSHIATNPAATCSPYQRMVVAVVLSPVVSSRIGAPAIDSGWFQSGMPWQSNGFQSGSSRYVRMAALTVSNWKKKCRPSSSGVFG